MRRSLLLASALLTFVPLAPGAETAVPAPVVAVAAPTPMCVAARNQVVRWSRRHARAPGRAHVVSIRGAHLVANNVARSPANGILLSCQGRAKLSNGLHQPVVFGVRAVATQWYLFLKRAKPRP